MFFFWQTGFVDFCYVDNIIKFLFQVIIAPKVNLI
jgi:hypothetical protein